ncbi:hypothetical protein AB0469_35115 [Streptomyces sp. NPDC093801]|uniref:hypothetical protein n=1 Tax=Streptomyces sp. NPDC093801 TaxID=3155203 RepID=UPI00344C8BDA
MSDAVKACNAGWRDPMARKTLEARLDHLRQVEEAYEHAGQTRTLLALLHTQEFQKQHKDADAHHLLAAYEGLVDRVDGRALYDALKASAVHGTCPLCGIGEVATLDHHAPKSRFPLLAITPLNLVPACDICNKCKSSTLPPPSGPEDLHPYFDDLGKDRWLFAEVADGSGIAEFTVRPPTPWLPVTQARLIHHFNRYSLDKRYRERAVSLLFDRRRSDLRTYDLVGPEGLRDDLLIDAASHGENDPNSWKTALLHGLASSSWYTNGGMKDL